MIALISIFSVRFKLQLQYRAATIAGVGTQVFFGFVMVMVYHAFYENGVEGLPMTLSQTVTYVWLGQGLLALLPWNGDREVQAMIRTGDVAYELARPIGLYEFWFFKILAQRVAQTSMRMIPLFLIVIFVMPDTLKMQGPVSLTGFAAFFLTMIGAVILGCTISNIITISTLFTIGSGLDRVIPAVVMFCSGLVIPLALFPDWSQWFFRLLPFSGLTDMPYRFYIGLYDVNMVGFAVIHQVLWSLVLMAFGQWMLNKAKKRIIVQGG